MYPVFNNAVLHQPTLCIGYSPTRIPAESMIPRGVSPSMQQREDYNCLTVGGDTLMNQFSGLGHIQYSKIETVRCNKPRRQSPRNHPSSY